MKTIALRAGLTLILGAGPLLCIQVIYVLRGPVGNDAQSGIELGTAFITGLILASGSILAVAISRRSLLGASRTLQLAGILAVAFVLNDVFAGHLFIDGRFAELYAALRSDWILPSLFIGLGTAIFGKQIWMRINRGKPVVRSNDG